MSKSDTQEDLTPPTVERNPTARPRYFAAHWRLRQFSLDHKSINFSRFAARAWFGPLRVSNLQLAEGDLSIGGQPISQATPDELRICASTVQERHQAANWVRGYDPEYSEVDTST